MNFTRVVSASSTPFGEHAYEGEEIPQNAKGRKLYAGTIPGCVKNKLMLGLGDPLHVQIDATVSKPIGTDRSLDLYYLSEVTCTTTSSTYKCSQI